MGNGKTFLSDGELPEIHEVQEALQRALTTTTKPMVRACYPRQDYENSDVRMQITANLADIRENINIPNTVKFSVDIILDGGGYTSDIEPNFAVIQMSYAEFLKLSPYSFFHQVVKPLINTMQTWDKVHGIVEDKSDIFSDYIPSEAEQISGTSTGDENINFIETIKTLVNNGQKLAAIKLYRETTGAGLPEAKAAVEKYEISNSINTNVDYNGVSRQEQTAPQGAEYWMNMFGIFGLTPFTFWVGIFTLCFVKKAKEENDGELSECAKKGLKRGVVGFVIYTVIILLLIVLSGA